MKTLSRIWMHWFTQITCGFGAKMFFGIGMGPSGDEKAMFKLLANIGTFGTQKGQQDVTAGSRFFEDILSGDPTKMAQAIAPETKVIQGQAEQRKKQNAEFGTRSGGTAATNANIDTEKIAGVQDLVNRLRPAAAGNLENIGLNLLGEGASSASAGFGAASHIQDQELARWNDIFNSIKQIASGAMGLPSAPSTGVVGAL